ncbi:hypothetical protein HDU76_008145, partial [Blyttiomyces sp. JEL0837]
MLALTTLLALIIQIVAVKAWIPGDRHPQSPLYGGRGSTPICHDELILTNKNQFDIYTTVNTGNVTFTDRKIPISIWLPLPITSQDTPTPTGVASPSNHSITYQFPTPVDLITGSSFISYPGVAKRGCGRLGYMKLAKKVPLVILSHGHPGKKELWSGHAEALASKGFAVVAIDHTDSLWTTLPKLNSLGTASLTSSLLNRRQDQLFVYDQIASLSTDAKNQKAPFLYNNVDATKTTIVGFSFGG